MIAKYFNQNGEDFPILEERWRIGNLRPYNYFLLHHTVSILIEMVFDCERKEMRFSL